MDIRVFKLISGEEIVAKVEVDEECEGVYKIVDVRMLAAMQTQQGVQVGFQPWLFATDPSLA
mgnify:CR=1 FL=1